MTIRQATDGELQSALHDLQNWSIVEGKLHREYIFSDFVEAFGFMTEIALIAERQNHHPEWFNVYKKIVVDLTTHEASGITERDFELARHMERIAGQA